MATLRLTVNGKTRNVRVDDANVPLLYVLRDDLGLRGPRFGCGLSQCGACTVHVNGESVRSCVYPSSSAVGKKVVTLEGEEQAAQCGYCINGMIMEAAALLSHKKNPTDAEIKAALADNLCRCGTHLRIVRAVKRAAGAKT
ncbi:MAG: (2Fe-2S)-binding protein [Deltaproteobacteria bacterium]|nr:MAG: (2Fe-2S)-binding protein [Deltaproteobacteria bacterium]